MVVEEDDKVKAYLKVAENIVMRNLDDVSNLIWGIEDTRDVWDD